ncbi:MAG: HAD family hydrolase, partial [Deltaproteobacteria bacterium]
RRGALFLDRDGVLIEDVHFLRTPEAIRILPGVVETLRALQERYPLVVVTNQSGIARGFFSEGDLLRIHESLLERFRDAGVFLDAIYYCPHLPEGRVAAYAVRCACRKPRPGLLLRAMETWGIDPAASLMIGDSPRDVAAGHAAGVKSILFAPASEKLPGTLHTLSRFEDLLPLVEGEP